jgi:ABC-type antimicrobial peptide transport system permease subunit
MGRLLLISRFVIGDIKRRRVQSALLLLMIVTTTATLTLGLALHHVSENPFARTRAATYGPDAVIEVGGGEGGAALSPAPFTSLIHAPGVTGVAGPYPVAFMRLQAAGHDLPVQVEGRDLAPAAIDRPLVTSGGWVSAGGAVIEQGLADAVGLRVGDTIRLAGHAFPVVGIALTTAQEFYPAATPGLVWLTRADTQALASGSRSTGYLLEVKLADPAAAPAFGDELNSAAFSAATAGEPYLFEAWQQVRANDYKVIQVDRKVLLIGSGLLAMLAVASIAVVVGGRMAEQTRRVGLLKAIGATPRLIAVVLLAENLLLALGAAAVGLALGDLAAPLLADPGSGLIGTPATSPLTVTSVALVIAVAAAVAAAATLIPAIRAAQTSTLAALHDSARPPSRRAGLIEYSAGLPVPLLLGLRLMARRPRRAALTATSLAIAVAMTVAAITLHHNLDAVNQPATSTAFLVTSSLGQRINRLTFVISATLIVLAALNATFTTWATVIDAQRLTALARALGATPRQVTAALATAQLAPTVAAACIGIPAGLGLYTLAAHGPSTPPPTLLLLTVIPATLLVVAALTAVPARIGAARSVAEVLRSE